MTPVATVLTSSVWVDGSVARVLYARVGLTACLR